MTWWRWLLNGSDELTLPQDWLANRERLQHYEGYTRRQLQQGRVVADVDEMRRRAFWEGVEAKRQAARAVPSVRRRRWPPSRRNTTNCKPGPSS